MKAAGIQCHCGQRILRRDVMQRSWHVRVFGPSFMYLRFRCSRCRRLGERFVEQEQWDDSLLREVPAEMAPPERKRLAALGPITVDEVIEFHFALEQPGALTSLKQEVSPDSG
jgi:hypothetical protein